MRNIRIIAAISGIVVLSGFTPDIKNDKSGPGTPGSDKASKISWFDFEEAVKKSDVNSKKYFVYVYTDWCSYCKKLSGTTFTDPEVIQLLNEKFISVKVNAESRETFSFRGNDFKFVSNGSRGYNELAAALTNNRLSYPTLVFLDEKMNMIQPLPGYKSADELSIILRFLGDNIYEKMSFDDYYKQEKK